MITKPTLATTCIVEDYIRHERKNDAKTNQGSNDARRHTIFQEIHVGEIQLSQLVLLRRPAKNQTRQNAVDVTEEGRGSIRSLIRKPRNRHAHPRRTNQPRDKYEQVRMVSR
jgi:hypothetical protein